MNSRRVITRRGTSIAAAALSIALVSPFLQPVAAPHTAATATAQTNPAPTWPAIDAGTPSQPGEEKVILPGEIEAIYSPATEGDDQNTVSGNVLHQHGQINYAFNNSTDDIGVTPMKGVKVYAQWIDDEGGKYEATSPVYYAVTDSNGDYRIKLQTFQDYLKRDRVFDSQPEQLATWGAREKIRVWTENPDPENLKPFWGYGNSLAPNDYAQDATLRGSGMWIGSLTAGVQKRVEGVTQWYTDRNTRPATSHKPADQWVNNDDRRMPDGEGQLEGRLFWEYGGEANTKTTFDNVIEYQSDIDRGVSGQKIVASYLTDAAIIEIREYFKANQAVEYSGADSLRGDGWNSEYENKLQDWIHGQIAKHPEWIAESVETTTGQDGEYIIQFNGIYGTYPMNPRLVPEEKWDTVAASPNDGRWAQNIIQAGDLNKTEDDKHVNWEWMNLSLVNKDGSLDTPAGVAFVDPWRGGKWSGRSGNNFRNSYKSLELAGSDDWSARLFTSADSDNALRWDNIDLGLTLANPTLQIVDYDAISKFAKPGDQIRTSTTGVAPLGDNAAKYDIVWTAYDAVTGEPIELTGAECTGLVPDDSGNLPSCGFTVPQDLPNTTEFQATLYPIATDGTRSNQLASDTFIAQVAYVPVYEGVETIPGRTVVSGEPTFDNTSTKEIETSLPEGTEVTSFELAPNAPEGASVDAETGKVTYVVPKTMTVIDPETAEPIEVPFEGEVTIPVLAKYNDRTEGIGEYVVTVKKPLADVHTPEYTTTKVKVGTNKDSNDPFADADPALKKVDAAKVAGSEWTFAGKADKGQVNGAAPALETVAARFDEIFPNGAKYSEYVKDGVVTNEELALITNPTTTVTITYGDDTIEDPTKAPFVLLGKDGKPVTDPEGDFDDDDTPNDEDNNPFDPDVTTNADEYVPAYESKLVKPDTEVTSKPVFTAKDGTEGAIPAGATAALDKFTAPDGYKVTVGKDGTVTVSIAKADVDKDTAESFDVPVIITYKDGSTDSVNAPFKLDTDGDGIPDVDDKDDDDDGFTDEEEKDAGTDPKDPASNPAKINVDDATVIEGKSITPIPVTATIPTDGSVAVTNLPEGLKYNPETKKIEGTPDKLEDWGKAEEEREVTVVAQAKKANGDVLATDEAIITVQRDTDDDGIPDVDDPDDDNDGVDDETEKEQGTDPKVAEDANKYEPVYQLTQVKVGDKDFSNDPFADADPKLSAVDPEAVNGSEWAFAGETVKGYVEGQAPTLETVGAKFKEIFPNGAKYDEYVQDGKVINPLLAKVTNPETSVTVTYGDKTQDFATAPFELLGKDGKPITDPEGDFDGDGSKNKDDKDPFNPDETTDAAAYEPAYDLTQVRVGEKGTSSDPFKDADPQLKSVEVEGVAGSEWAFGGETTQGKVDGQAPSIDVVAQRFDEIFPNGAKYEDYVRDGKVVSADLAKITNPEPDVTITYGDNSFDNGHAPFELLGKDGKPITDPEGDFDDDDTKNKDDKNPFDDKVSTDANAFEPSYKEVLVVPGKDAVSTPTFTDEAGKPVNPPAGTTFEQAEFEVPAGYTVKVAKDGTVTVTVDPDVLNADTVEAFEVPVVVTYPDGSSESAKAPFALDTDEDGTPDGKDDDDDNDGIKDEEEKEKGSNPKDAGEIPWLPLGPSILNPRWEDDSTPEGKPIVIDNVGGDTKPGTTVEVKEGDADVEISKEGDITVTPGEDAKPGDKIVVEVKDPEGKVIDTVVVVISPNWPDGETTNDKPIVLTPEGKVEPGTTVEVAGPGTAVIDASGKITVTPGKDAKPGEVITVTVKDPAGRVIDTITVTIIKITDVVDPSYEQGTQVEQNTTKVVPAPTFVDADGNVVDTPEGTTFGPGANVPEWATVNEDGSITVAPGYDVTPGDYGVDVVVTYPDGTSETVTVPVEVTSGGSHSGLNDPRYGGVVTVPTGQSRDTTDPFETTPLVEGTTVDEIGISSEGADGWIFEEKEGTTGVITATAPDTGVLAQSYNKINPDRSITSLGAIVEAMKPITDPTINVEFVYGDGTSDKASAGFTLVGLDGKPISDPDGDFDGDGTNNKTEVEKGTNPFDASAKPMEVDEPEVVVQRCFVDPETAVFNPIYWLIPAGILLAVPLPAGVKAELDGVAAGLNNEVNQLAGQLGLGNLLPRTTVDGKYVNGDTARTLIGAIMVVAGLVATGFYFSYCSGALEVTSSGSSDPDNDYADNSSIKVDEEKLNDKA